MRKKCISLTFLLYRAASARVCTSRHLPQLFILVCWVGVCSCSAHGHGDQAHDTLPDNFFLSEEEEAALAAAETTADAAPSVPGSAMSDTLPSPCGAWDTSAAMPTDTMTPAVGPDSGWVVPLGSGHPPAPFDHFARDGASPGGASPCGAGVAAGAPAWKTRCFSLCSASVLEYAFLKPCCCACLPSPQPF